MLNITPLSPKTSTLDEMFFCCRLHYKLQRLAIVKPYIVRRGTLTEDSVLRKDIS